MNYSVPHSDSRYCVPPQGVFNSSQTTPMLNQNIADDSITKRATTNKNYSVYSVPRSDSEYSVPRSKIIDDSTPKQTATENYSVPRSESQYSVPRPTITDDRIPNTTSNLISDVYAVPHKHVHNGQHQNNSNCDPNDAGYVLVVPLKQPIKGTKSCPGTAAKGYANIEKKEVKKMVRN